MVRVHKPSYGLAGARRVQRGGQPGLPEGGAGAQATTRNLADLPGVRWALWGLSRHKWTAAAVWLAFTAAAAAWVWRLPSVYQSEAVILAESRRIPERLVPASVDTDLEGRLERARQKLLSSAELQAVMRRLNLYEEQLRAGASVDSVVERFRRSLAIAPVDVGARGRLGPFRVTFQGPDAGTAARVANYVALRFIEEASQARRSSSGAAALFLSSHASTARRELDLREAALRDFRLEHSEELPEQAESLRATARRLRAELSSLREEIPALEREKRALEQAQWMAVAEPASAAKSWSGVAVNGSTSAASGPRRSQAEELKKRLAELLAIYKPEHPDVRRLRAELAQAQSLEVEPAARAPAEPKANGTTHEPSRRPPGNDAARARLGLLEVRLEALAARRIQLAAELGSTEQRLQRMPLRQQQLAALTREQAFFSEQYRSLAARQQSAEMAEALERSYPSERVTLLDQARPPEKPIGPKRWSLLGAASLGGLFIGCLLAVARTIEAPAWGRLEPAVPAESEEEHPSYITA